MKRRSKVGGKAGKAGRRKAATPKRSVPAKAVPGRRSAATGQETETARLTRELKEALERQWATAEVLNAISRSKFELQTILQTVVDTASRLCRADASVIFQLEGGVYRFAAGYSLNPTYVEHERQTPISPGPGTLVGRAAMSWQVVRIEDAWTDPLYEQKAVVGVGRSMLGMPLMHEGEPIGVIGLSRNRVDPFAQREVELVSTFAAQAVIAIENARLFEAEQQRTRELRESLEQQTATADVLRVISSSPGELQPVFQTMLQNAVRICNAKFGNLWVREGDKFRIVAMHGASQEYRDVLFSEPLLQPHPQSAGGRAVSTGQVVQIADISTAPTYGEKMRTATIELAKARTLVTVPMLKEQEVVGIITIYRQEVRPFTDKQVDLLRNFAAQAVIAIENTRLLNELRQRTNDLTESLEQQTATSEVLGVISSSPGELEPVFQTMLENATRICEAKFGTLFLCEGDTFRVVAMHNEPAALAEWRLRQPVFRPGPGLALTRSAQLKQVIQVADITADKAYFEGDPDRRAVAKLGGYRAVLAVPMIKDDQVIGVFTIFRQEPGPFTDKQIALVQNFAAQAVIAIENTRLLNELRQRTDDLSESLEQQTATSKVLEVISRSAFDLHAVFETVAESSVRLCGADRAFIFRFDGELLRMAVAYNSPPEFTAWVEQHPIRPGRHSGSARAALERRTIHIPDVRVDPEYTYGAKDAEAIRTVLGVPILKGDDLLGVMMIYHLEGVRPFTEKQIALVETFADQAAIAIENARLFEAEQQRTRELSESLEQQTATAEVLQVINASPGALAPVFEAMLEKAMHLCEADFGGLWTMEEDRYVAVALRGVPQPYATFLAETTAIPGPGTAPYRFLRGERLIHNLDLAAEEPYRTGDPQRRALVDLGGARTALQVPLSKEDAVLGVITIYRQEVQPFTDKQIALVQNFAAQAVIAIENTRLLNELRESLQQQTATADVLKVISRSTFDLEAVLNTLVEAAARLCGADKAQILRPSEKANSFYSAASYGHSPEYQEYFKTITIAPGREGVVGRVLLERKPVQIADVLADPEYQFTEAQRLGGFRTHLGLPLLREGNPIGILVVSRVTVRPFDDKHIELLTTFADQAVIAIENTRLLNELRQSLQQQTATADVLKVISRSTFDLQAVLDTLVEVGSALVRGGHGSNPPPDRGRLLRRGEIRLLARIH